MPRPARLQRAFCCQHLGLGGLNVEVALQCGVNPLVFVLGVRINDGKRFRYAVELAVRASGQGAKRLEEDVLISVCLDPSYDGIVVDGLCLEHICDCHQADVEALLYLFQLAFDGGFFCRRRLQQILGPQHVEIGFDDAHDELLLRGGEGALGLGNARLGAGIVEPACGIEYRLAHLCLPAVVVEVVVWHRGDRPAAGVNEAAWKTAFVPGRLPTGGNVRQQGRTCLRHGFLTGLVS